MTSNHSSAKQRDRSLVDTRSQTEDAELPDSSNAEGGDEAETDKAVAGRDRLQENENRPMSPGTPSASDA